MQKLTSTLLSGLVLGLPTLALSEDAPIYEISYILKTFSLLIMGIPVLWMAAGFAAAPVDTLEKYGKIRANRHRFSEKR